MPNAATKDKCRFIAGHLMVQGEHWRGSLRGRTAFYLTNSVRESFGRCRSDLRGCGRLRDGSWLLYVFYRVPEIVTRGRFPDGGESDSTWRTQEARHVGSDTIAPGF